MGLADGTIKYFVRSAVSPPQRDRADRPLTIAPSRGRAICSSAVDCIGTEDPCFEAVVKGNPLSDVDVDKHAMIASMNDANGDGMPELMVMTSGRDEAPRLSLFLSNSCKSLCSGSGICNADTSAAKQHPFRQMCRCLQGVLLLCAGILEDQLRAWRHSHHYIIVPTRACEQASKVRSAHSVMTGSSDSIASRVLVGAPPHEAGGSSQALTLPVHGLLIWLFGQVLIPSETTKRCGIPKMPAIGKGSATTARLVRGSVPV